MKITKGIQNQLADFKAEFVRLCLAFDGKRDERGEHTGGENSAFIIPAPWGKIRTSIGKPWNTTDETLRANWHKHSSAEIFISATDYTELPDCWGSCSAGSTRKHWKWNIHRSLESRGLYADCYHAALIEFANRMEAVTGRKASQMPCEPKEAA